MKLFSKSKKLAIILTYAGIIAQTLCTIFLTDLYLDKLGSDSYGLFQMINSVAQYILILDLGFSTVMVRYISEFEARDEHQNAENFAFHFGIIVLCTIIVMAAVGVIINNNIESIYQTLTPAEYAVSHRMFRMILGQIIATIVLHFFQGILFAYDQYALEKILSLGKILLNAILSVFLVINGFGILGITIANSIVTLLHMAIEAYYALFVLKFRIRLSHWQFSLLKPAFLLMLAMLLQSVVGHVNGTVDKTILGIMAAKTDVTVYSIAATIITMFNSLPTAISSVFQSQTVRVVTNGCSGEQLTDYVIRPGRIQFMLLGGFFAGFVLFGQDFIVCWTNREMLDAWKYVLIIMVPNAVPLVQNVCLSILNAMDKRLYRSMILVAITGINIGLTVVLIRAIGPIGAPLATGISYLIGHVLLMNIYYQRKIGLNVLRMFREIVRGTTPCVAAAFLLNLPLVFWKVDGSWAVLFVKGVVFCLIYAFLLIRFSMNEDEKNMANHLLKKIHIKLVIK